jgi:hypothetical protein
MATRDGQKTGGRVAGTPNKGSRELRTFLDGVFAEAFANPAFRVELILQITTLKIDTKLLVRLLEYWAGAPPKEHKHTGKFTLAQLIAGTAVEDENEDEDPAAPAGEASSS